MLDKMQHSPLKELMETLKKRKILSAILALVIIQFIIFQFIFQIIIVNGDLNKNIDDGDILFNTRHFSEIERGDILTFKENGTINVIEVIFLEDNGKLSYQSDIDGKFNEVKRNQIIGKNIKLYKSKSVIKKIRDFLNR